MSYGILGLVRTVLSSRGIGDDIRGEDCAGEMGVERVGAGLLGYPEPELPEEPLEVDDPEPPDG